MAPVVVVARQDALHVVVLDFMLHAGMDATEELDMLHDSLAIVHF